MRTIRIVYKIWLSKKSIQFQTNAGLHRRHRPIENHIAVGEWVHIGCDAIDPPAIGCEPQHPSMTKSICHVEGTHVLRSQPLTGLRGGVCLTYGGGVYVFAKMGDFATFDGPNVRKS